MKKSEFEERIKFLYRDAENGRGASLYAELAGVTWDPEEPQVLAPDELKERCRAPNGDLPCWDIWEFEGNLKKGWGARFRRAVVDAGREYVGEFGRGDTPREAMEDYCRVVSGKRLVFNVASTNCYKVDV